MRGRSERAAASGSRPWPTHGPALVTMGIGLAVTTLLAVAAWSAHQRTEDHIMDRRTREGAAVFTAAVASIETPLASAAELITVTDDAAALQAVLAPVVGEGRRFSSVSVWALDGSAPRPLQVLGAPPRLLAHRDVIDGLGSGGPGLQVIDLLAGTDPTIGYAYLRDVGAAHVVYAEIALPADRTSVPQADSAFADLHYAVYLDEEAPEQLLVADATDLPLEGRRSSERVALGGSELVVVMSATGVLGSALSAVLPWFILGAGLVLSLVVGMLVERVLRRSDLAAALAEDVSRIARENEVLYSEQRSVAQTLQQSLLLDQVPVVSGVELATRYAAGAEGVEVGGDWYDVILRGEDCILLVVGDVSGRGVRAATVMASLRYAIRALGIDGDAPETILTKLSKLLSVEQDGHFATILLAEIDPRKRTMAIASAGHPSPLVLSGGDASFVPTETGVPVGVTRTPTYRTVEWEIPPGATLLGFTDGLYERRGETVDVGLERLRSAALPLASLPLPELLERLARDLAGSATDDAAILGVRWPTRMTPPRS